MMNASKKKSNMPLLVAGLIVLVGGWGVQVTYAKYAEAKSLEKHQRDLLAVAQTQLSQLQAFSDEYKAIPEEVNKLRHVIPVGTELAEVVAQFESVAQQSGLQYKSIIFNDGPASGKAEKKTSELPSGVKALPITVQVGGPYASFRTYIGLLEDNIRLVDVNSISIQNGVYNLGVTVYYLEK